MSAIPSIYTAENILLRFTKYDYIVVGSITWYFCFRNNGVFLVKI